MVKFLPSYVGSKAFWVEELSRFSGRFFVELFAGSASLSAGLAGEAILNDSDEYVYKILSRYDELISPKIFTRDDYYKYRAAEDWWKYSYCLQKMSFSGVFRYSKNGYNVPCKKIEKIFIRDDYVESLNRWLDLNPMVTKYDFFNFPLSLLKNAIVVIDPPYEGSQASYNGKFDYHLYWQMVQKIEGICSKIILFDNSKNLPFENIKTRRMVANGKHKKNEEGMFIFEDSLKVGKQGEREFHSLNPDLVAADGFNYDFKMKNGKKIELKSDYYDMEKTENFFIERYSYGNKSGGPWQSLEKGVDFYIYFFPKNKTAFLFKTEEMVSVLDSICDEKNLISIGNDGYVTRGYKINRKQLECCLIKKRVYDDLRSLQ